MSITGGYIEYQYQDQVVSGKFLPSSDNDFPGLTVSSQELTADGGNRLRVTCTAQEDEAVVIHKMYLETEIELLPKDRIFCNGFQSWTESREFRVTERMKRISMILNFLGVSFHGDYTIYPYSGKRGILHSYTYSYIRSEENFTFFGSLDESTGYTIFAYNTRRPVLIIQKNCRGLHLSESSGPYTAFDVLEIQGDESEEEHIFSAYFKRLELSRNRAPLATGWTSWYNYYTDVTEAIVLENLKAFRENDIPIDVFQVDDGYQRSVGDWLKQKLTFPSGMEYIAEKIKDAGYKAGLWLAPFVCDKHSMIYWNHSDWLLRDDRGKLQQAGYAPLWGGAFYALDIYNSEVQDYLKEVFHTVFNTWKFDMVKLDFLYAAALQPRDDKTRGEIMNDAMKLLREWAGDKLILGCGVPLGSSFGKVDYCRIGGDIALKWEDRLLRKLGYRERVSTVNSLKSSIGRRHLNGPAFINDPDVIQLRKKNTKLNREQRYTLLMLNNIFGGLVFTSDNISLYSEKRKRLFCSIFPLMEKNNIQVNLEKRLYTICFDINNKSYIVCSNFSKMKKRVVIGEETDGSVYFRNNSGENSGGFIRGGTKITIPPYGSVCYLCVEERDYTIAGTTAHLFPGSEILSLMVSENSITLAQDEKVRNSNTVFIRVPGAGEYLVNKEEVSAEEIYEDLYVVKLLIEKRKEEEKEEEKEQEVDNQAEDADNADESDET